MEALEDPWEHMVMRELERCANAGEPCPTVTEFSVMLDCAEGGTVVGIMNRLVDKGHIKREVFHRERQITIMATGARTAEPRNKTPHWWEAAISLAQIRRRDASLAYGILQLAQSREMLVSDLLFEMVARDFAAIHNPAAIAEGA